MCTSMTLSSGGGPRRLLPHVARQRLARDDLACMPQQVLEQLELAHRQLHGFPPRVTLRVTRSIVQIADVQPGRRSIRTAAPQQRANPREHLGERERLDEVIVGAAVETEHPVLQRVARREHQHACVLAALPQRRYDLKSVPAGKHRDRGAPRRRFPC